MKMLNHHCMGNPAPQTGLRVDSGSDAKKWSCLTKRWQATRL